MSALAKIQFTLQQEIMKMAQVNTLTPTQDIFAEGIIGSLHALQLVQFIEDHWSLPLEDEDLNQDTFRSLQSLTDLVATKTR